MKKTTLLTTLFLPVVATATDNPRPNVILILADDLGYGDLSCYGATRVQTPHIDSLAAHGTRFTNAHAAASTSTPSRYALLTGTHPFRNPGTDVANGDAASIITPEQPSLARLFQQNGYTTAAIGKWHLGLGTATGQQNWNDTLDLTPAHLGFDHHHIMAATADRVPCVWINDSRVANWDATQPIAVSYTDTLPGEDLLPSHATKLSPSHGHNGTIVNGINRIGHMTGGGTALWQDENIADTIARHATQFIENNADKPFFLYLATNDIHVPRYPHDRFRGNSPMGLRGDAIAQLEWTVGQIVETLHRLNLTDNTILIITSDNGPVLDDGYADQAEQLCGAHRPGGPFRGGKYSAFEAGSAIPLIICGKDIPQRKQSDALLSLTDCIGVMAHLLHTTNPSTDSQDAYDTWFRASKQGRPYAVYMASNRSLQIRTKRWKYISPSNGAPIVPWGTGIETGYSPQEQLYDLRHSPYENNNVASKHPLVVKRMQNLLRKLTAK